jgi:hypothetical protein
LEGVLSVSHVSVAGVPSSLSADPSVFRQKFDRTPFRLAHSFARHPLFEIPRLLQLAQFLKRNVHNVAFDAGDVRVDQRWKYRSPNPYTLEEAMERIDHTGAWVILKHTELDPEYRALMDAIMSDVERLSGQKLRKLTKNVEAQIMITSPGRITPYHFDNECNVLLQINGEKDLFVFDQTDREVLTEVELEKFWVGDWNAGEYKARCQERAHAFRLTPGAAVHIPVNAPHWVKNDANVSLSLSVNFEWKDELVYNVYRANYFLRKIGAQPNPPGRSAVRDSLKHTVMALGFVPARDTAKRAVRFLRRVKHATRFHPSSKSAPL